MEPQHDLAVPGTDALAHGLTRREQQLVQLMAWGKTNAEIAAELGLSLETVKTHARNTLWQLGAANRAEAVAIALRAGAIT